VLKLKMLRALLPVCLYILTMQCTNENTILIQITVRIKYFLPAVILKKEAPNFLNLFLKTMEGEKITCFPIL
jgi:hypothetical protein